MLPDFIERNDLQARILPYAAKGSLVRCELFFAGSSPVLVIHFARQALDLEKVKKAAGVAELRNAGPEEALEATGFSLQFMPPISIYGVKVLVDARLQGGERLHCLVGEEKTLEISGQEIVEANEEALVAGLTN